MHASLVVMEEDVLRISNRIQLFQGDITQVDADAIVTAANSALCGGGGVDGAVHRAAGPQLVEASMELAPCPAGEARLTEGFNLKAKYVIHAVGPVFSDLQSDSPTLAGAYRSSLKLAAENNVQRIAFPCISTGVYGFPQQEACEIAVTTVIDWLKENDKPEQVIFCTFGAEGFQLYQTALV